MKILLRGLSATIFLAATACSPVNYEKPIVTLGTAVTDTVATVSALDKKMTAARNDQSRAALVANPPGAILDVTNDSCDQSATACSLIITMSDGTEGTFPATTVMPKAHVGLAALNQYTDNLMTIVSADTADKVTASANAALGSVANIETALREAQGQTGKVSKLVQYNEPVGQLIGWLVGIYVDSVKVSALRKATNDANPVIQSLATFHAGIGLAVTDYEVGSAAVTFITARNVFDEKSEAGTLKKEDVDKFAQAAQAYNHALSAQAAKPLAIFAEAHMKLTQQLNGKNDVNIPDVFAVIEEVKLQADAFKEILKAFEGVSEKEG